MVKEKDDGGGAFWHFVASGCAWLKWLGVDVGY